ncbi:MAG TPA: class I SAM-dependent methyltransferase [Thermoanaerobaculia bacterium]|nr:class I SAM-dependent methyltransferase [Thermoanaerobaculia bacterium]
MAFALPMPLFRHYAMRRLVPLPLAMPQSSQPPTPSLILPEEASSHYTIAGEIGRLAVGAGRLELVRSREILGRLLPPPPAVVLDVGGGPGVYACWLAGLGYEVHLVDAVPLHVEQAEQASRSQPGRPLASARVGDARRLEAADGSAAAVLLMGPLYHLTERGDRLAALREAWRALAPGGRLFATGISRFASALDGLVHGFLDDPVFARIVERDLTDGQHRNPTDHPLYFTTTFFHRPEEIREEIVAAGFRCDFLLAIEGPPWLLQDLDAHWNDPARRERLLGVIRRLEAEPSLLGASAHLMAVATPSPSP